MRKLKFLDLFAGIGGFRMALERAGNKCIGYVEIDKFARKSYEAIYDTDGEWTRTDITKITDAEWAEFNGKADLIVGGFPCQAFSIAGKRKGFDDTRGTLFFEVARAVNQIQPSYILLEKVKGLLNHDKGKTFKTILKTLDELGYDVEWNVFNSKYFGVPQNRERVFIIGNLRTNSKRKVLPRPKAGGKINLEMISAAKWTEASRHTGQEVYRDEGVAATITTKNHIKDVPKYLIGASRGRNPENTNDRRTGSPTVQRLEINENNTSNALKTVQKDNLVIIDDTQTGFDGIRTYTDNAPTLRANRFGLKVAEEKIIQRGRGKNKGGVHDVAPTVSCKSYQDNNHLIDRDLKVRKLTPRECWRLQGFPDWAFDRAEKVNSEHQLYKQAGNAVTVNVVEWISKNLVEIDWK